MDLVSSLRLPRSASLSLRRLWIAVIVVATLGYYYWTALVVPGPPPRIRGPQRDHFNLLSHGFLKGQLHLDHEPSPQLLAAPNPYDPALRSHVPLLYDASFYHGKYYIYFGPAPVVTLLLPFRVLTGRDLPVPYAVWLYASVGYLALVGIILFLQRRHFPSASLIALTTALVGVGGAGMLTAVLRRPDIWELAATSGFAFFSLSLLALVRAVYAPRPVWWTLLGGFALGLAVASRPTYLLCSVLFVLPWLLRSWIRPTLTAYNFRAVLAAAVACGIPVLVLLAYNYARFGNALEFGQRYQLTGIVEGEARHFSAEYVPFNVRMYFLAPLRWIGQFPFVDGIKLPPKPAGFGEHEYTFGVLPNLPFALFAVVPLLGLLRARAIDSAFRVFWLIIALIAGAAAINAALLLTFFGCCIRYMIDFTPYLMVLAAFGVFAGEAWLTSRSLRAVWLGGALALALFSSCLAAAGVVRFYESAAGGYPMAYRRVARTLNTWALRVRETRTSGFGPRQIEFSLPPDRTPREEVLLSVRQQQRDVARVLIEYLDAERIRFGYREPGSTRPTAYSATIAAPANRRHTLHLSVGDAASTAAGPGGRVRARCDDFVIWDAPVVSFDTFAGDLRIGPDAASDERAPRFTGVIHTVRPADLPFDTELRYAGIRARLELRPDMIGKAYPLLTTGRTKAGDFLTLEVHPNNQISLGYDHWGVPSTHSPTFPASIGETHIVEYWVPVLFGSTGAGRVVVRVDGATVWDRTVPFYLIDSDAVFPGSNLIGGSSSERLLPHAVFEDVQLPLPANTK